MRPSEESLKGRACVLVGCLGVSVLAVLAGVGGPPSEFQPNRSPVVALLGDHILEIYLAGAVVAFVSVLAGLASGRAGRIVGTFAVVLTTLGNMVSVAIAAEAKGEVKVTLFFAALSAPFVLLMWLPRRSGRSAASGRNARAAGPA